MDDMPVQDLGVPPEILGKLNTMRLRISSLEKQLEEARSEHLVLKTLAGMPGLHTTGPNWHPFHVPVRGMLAPFRFEKTLPLPLGIQAVQVIVERNFTSDDILDISVGFHPVADKLMPNKGGLPYGA